MLLNEVTFPDLVCCFRTDCLFEESMSVWRRELGEFELHFHAKCEKGAGQANHQDIVCYCVIVCEISVRVKNAS